MLTTADVFREWIWPAGGSGGIPGDVFATYVCVVISGCVTYAFWPKFRRTIDAWVKRHLKEHHDTHVAPGHDALHAKLDHLLDLLEPKEK
jgi:hypothetical protein